MSQENVDLVRDAIEAFNRGDLEWLLERIDEDFVFDWTRSLSPLSGIYRGPDGVAEFIREQWNTFEEFAIEPLEFIDRGRHVVVPNTLRARGRDGIEVTVNNAHVYTVENGRSVSVVMYQELEDALAAAVE
jgi:ketosteroid isomerase-like protein